MASPSGPFALAVIGLALAVLIHPMVMPLGLVLLWHALRSSRLSARRAPAGAGAFALLLAAPWLSYLPGACGCACTVRCRSPLARRRPPLTSLPPEPAVSFFTPLFFPFLGGVQLSGLGLHYFVGEDFWVGREILWLPGSLAPSRMACCGWDSSSRCSAWSAWRAGPS